MRFSVKVLAVAAVAAAAACMGDALAAETVKISESMKCQNGASMSLKKLAKKNKYDWDEAAKSTKSWVEAAGDLAKNKPPLGEEKSWKDQTDKYLTNVKAVDAAVQKKDSAALGKAMTTFDGSCGGCHS